MLGGRGEGWKVANETLKHERAYLANPGLLVQRYAEVQRVVKEETLNGQRAVDDPALRDRLMDLQGRVLAQQCHGMRLLTLAERKQEPGLAGLISKLQGCEIRYQLSTLAIDALGEAGLLTAGSAHARAEGIWQERNGFDLGLIIGGGTAQIQKNIIAERGLEMPREPKSAA